MAKKGARVLKITKVRSVIGRKEKAKRTVAALGLKRIHQTVLRADTPEIRGMIRKVDYLLKVEEVEE